MGLVRKLSELEGDMQQWLNQSRQLLLAAIAELTPVIASATIRGPVQAEVPPESLALYREGEGD